MSKIEVNAIEPQCGTTLTVGAVGTTVAVPALARVTPEGILTVSPDVPKVKVVPDCGST